MIRTVALALALCVPAIPALAQSVLAPSGLVGTPAKYDRKNVTALGIAEHIVVRPAGGGTVFTQFQLCDGSACVNVITNGPPKVTNGQNTSVNGTFYTFFVRGPVQAKDVIVAG